jgi:hypothetical protein
LFVGDLYISPTGILNIPVSTTLYANSTTNDGIINGSITSAISDQVPQAIELRFKPDQLNVTSSYVNHYLK